MNLVPLGQNNDLLLHLRHSPHCLGTNWTPETQMKHMRIGTQSQSMWVKTSWSPHGSTVPLLSPCSTSCNQFSGVVKECKRHESLVSWTCWWFVPLPPRGTGINGPDSSSQPLTWILINDPPDKVEDKQIVQNRHLAPLRNSCSQRDLVGLAEQILIALKSQFKS